jgi:ribonucleoside-diphosphate reductase alpha chain
MAKVSMETGIELALEKGAAPILEQDFLVDKKLLAKAERMGIRDFPYIEGDLVMGRQLFAESLYFKQVLPEDLIKSLAENGCRYTHATSIAPTGTISLSVCNNVSNGIEPTFAHSYLRNIIKEGKSTKEQIEVKSYERLALDAYLENNPEARAEDFVLQSTDDISAYWHLLVQAEAQHYVDSSISKTINVPKDFDFDQFKTLYMKGSDLRLKGVTTFRFNPEAFSGVLVKEQDLKDTYYTFVLSEGSEVTLRGDEKVEYEGQVHVAADLFDAIKEGYYGKF